MIGIKNKIIHDFIGFLLSVLFLNIILLFMNPNENNFELSLLPLLFVWLGVYFFISLVFSITGSAENRISRFISSILPTSIVFGLMLSALGEISLFDIVLLTSLTLLGVFYLNRTWSN